jgi:hypothetical protein
MKVRAFSPEEIAHLIVMFGASGSPFGFTTAKRVDELT